MFFRKRSDVYYDTNNAKILRDFNQAISALYALDSGAFSARDTLNLRLDTDEEIDKILQDVSLVDIAMKLSLVRSLVFGECLDWEAAAADLERESAAWEKARESGNDNYGQENA